MAQATVVAGRLLLIKVSDGGGSPIFAHPCMINAARGINFTAETNSQRVPDCDNPELIAWQEREKVSLSAAINGAGVLHTPDTEFYFDWFKSEDPIAVRVEFSGVSGANGGGYWAGDFHLTSFEITGDLGDKVQVSIGLESDGEVTWTDAA